MKQFSWVLFILPILLSITTYILRLSKIDAILFELDVFVIVIYGAIPFMFLFVGYLWLIHVSRKRNNMVAINLLHATFLLVICILLVKTALLPASNADLILKQAGNEEAFAHTVFERVQKQNPNETLQLTDYSVTKNEGSGGLVEEDSWLVISLSMDTFSNTTKKMNTKLILECTRFDLCTKVKGDLIFKD